MPNHSLPPSSLNRVRSRRLALAAALLLGLTALRAAEPVAAPTTQAEQAALTPGQALARLTAGNARFAAGHPLARDWAQARVQTAAAQYPFAVVLSCIDSRTASEIVFDQGFGDIFNVRLAGNVLDADALGSMEFACRLAGAKLIVVLGHTHCGAIKGACSGVELGHLTELLGRIRPAVDEAHRELPHAPAADADFIAKVTELNVRHVLQQIPAQSPVLAELLASGRVVVVGGVYDLDTGKVKFLTN